MTEIHPTISAFAWVPEFARGRVRDLRVRWALEEVGQPYDTILLNAAVPRGQEYVAWQPFDQVPAYRDDGVEMFESGAILLRIAETSGKLLPKDQKQRWLAISWLFAALNSVEPQISRPLLVALLHGEEPWAADAAEAMKPLARKRLQRLAEALGNREWLAGEFSVADIAMSTVFLNESGDLLAEHPTLVAYNERARARPAFRRALDAQMADFVSEPAGA